MVSLKKEGDMFSRLKEDKRGLTLVEAVISILILGIAVGSMLGAFLMSKVSITKAKYYIEVMNLLRHKMEELKNTSLDDITSVPADNISIDIGLDLKRGTDPDDPDGYDDLWGTILVEVKDEEDIDEDGNTVEEEIDINGDDITDCKTIYVTISWTNPTWGGGINVSEEVATLISK